MKKIIIFCLFFSGCLGCLCSDVSPKWNINEFDLSIYDMNFNSPVNGNIQGDSILLRINFSPKFVDSNLHNSFSLINSAYATKCLAPGYEGLQDQIINFTTTSNSEFNEFEAGESWSLLAPVNYYTALFDTTGIAQLDQDSLELALGFSVRVFKRMGLEFAFCEDLTRSAPDFTVHTRLSYIFGE